MIVPEACPVSWVHKHILGIDGAQIEVRARCTLSRLNPPPTVQKVPTLPFSISVFVSRRSLQHDVGAHDRMVATWQLLDKPAAQTELRRVDRAAWRSLYSGVSLLLESAEGPT